MEEIATLSPKYFTQAVLILCTTHINLYGGAVVDNLIEESVIYN